jgi:plastocyanin
MKMRKRILSLLLTLCMVMALLPTTVFAASTGDTFTSGNLQYRIVSETTVEVSGVANSPSDVAIPPTVQYNGETYTVVGIGSRAFINNSVLTSVTMPQDSSSFTYIEIGAFKCCTKITALEIPASVSRIGLSTNLSANDGAFEGMSSLESVTFATNSDGKASLRIVYQYTFGKCTKLKTLTLPEGVEAVATCIVTGCTSLSSLTIPSTVTELSSGFLIKTLGDNSNPDTYYGSSIVHIADGCTYKLQEGVLSTEKEIIKAYDTISGKYEVPDGVTTIEEGAFENQTELTSVTIPASVTSVGKSAFSGCTALKTVTFAETSNLEAIADSTFSGCTALRTITIPSSVTSIGDSAFYKSGLTGITIPSSVTSIGEKAFLACEKLTYINLPEGLTEIKDLSFLLFDYNDAWSNDEDYSKLQNEDPQLKYINIPASVTTLGEMFLGGLKADKETYVIFQGNTVPTCEEVDEDSFISSSLLWLADSTILDEEWKSTIDAAGFVFTPATILYPAAYQAAYTGEGSALYGLTDDDGAYGLTMSDSTVKVGDTVTFTADVPTDCTLTVESSDPNLATAAVNGDGKSITVTGKAAGEAEITAKVTLTKDDINYTLVEKPVTVTVVGADKEPSVVVSAGTSTPKADVGVSDATVNGVVSALTPSTVEGGSKGVTATETALAEAAKEAVQKNTVSADDGKQALEKANVTVNGGDTVSIVIQPYLDVTVKAATKTESATSLKLDITPMYRTVATTADLNTGAIVLSGKGQNAVELDGKGGTLDVTETTTVSVPLPENFFGTGEQTVYVKHIKKNGKTYVYTGTVKEDTLTFDNPHGFSSFEIGVEAPVAKIGGVGYTSLQAAVDEVQDGQTITLTSPSNNENITVSKNISFTVSGGTTALRAGSSYTMTKSGNTYTFAYVAGSGATAKYAVSVSGSTGGTVTASEKRAAAGTEVVLTVTPDTGKTVATVTVTDKNGKAVEVTANEDGTYSFTMPASKATVKATFQDEATEEPETPTEPETPEEPGDTTPTFTDVDKNQWYNEAIEYVVSKGVMEGNSNGTFTPNKDLTRAALAQILYNAAGKPEVTVEDTFTDVAADKWYATAITWAAQNGVVEGYDDGTFKPDKEISRQDLAVMLWRYAGKLEAGADTLESFTDAAKVNDYAQEALQWATENGIVQGKDNNVLDPKGNATRAQAATMVMRYLQLG